MFIDECLNNLSVLDEVETVFLSGIHSHDRNIILKYCIEHDISVYVIPRIGDVIMSGAKKNAHVSSSDSSVGTLPSITILLVQQENF